MPGDTARCEVGQKTARGIGWGGWKYTASLCLMEPASGVTMLRSHHSGQHAFLDILVVCFVTDSHFHARLLADGPDS